MRNKIWLVLNYIIFAWIFNSWMLHIQQIRKNNNHANNLHFSQTPKPVYRKLQHGEKIFSKFQSQPRFPRKMILYSLTKFVVIKTWTNIQWLSRLDLRFLQTSRQIYRKLKCTEKIFEKFQRLPRFLRKMVLDSSSKFCIFESLPTFSRT